MKPRSRQSRVRRGGRLLVLACLLLALLPPPLPWSGAALDVVVLVDDSLSMSRHATDLAWEQLKPFLAEVAAGSRLRLIRFAANPVLERVARDPSAAATLAIPRSYALDRTATDIAGALQAGLRLLPPGNRPAVMVLLSDAAATHGDTAVALEAVSRAGVPLYLVVPPAGVGGEPFVLRDLQVPTRVNVGDRVPVVALVEVITGEPLAVSLELGGRLEARQMIELVSGQPALAAFDFVPTEPGVKLLRVRVAQSSAPGGDETHAQQTIAVNVQGPAPVLYVSRQVTPNPVVDGLLASGREAQTVSPATLAAREPLLRQAGTIFLDDLAIGDLDESTWQALVTAVQIDGKGLAVLGGPNSFGAGAYRHSTLEEILPVTSEAAHPQAPAAVVFLLDRSGSMGRVQTGPSRFSLARKAVTDSVKMLLPDDHLGIITFATEAESRLPLAPRQVASTALLAALAVTPGGGTRLGPALQMAVAQLQQVETQQRLIVLVTDGFSDDEDLEPIARNLQVEGIAVIAMAVGKDPQLDALELLTSFNEGRILSVDQASTLPRLMSAAVATRRAPAVAAPTLPLPVQALPFPLDPDAAWPPLSAYMVSRARPAAQVYLQSSRGDPLFATGLAGAGRVVVLPAGLGRWASRWWHWPEFGTVLGGLVDWLEPGHGADQLSLSVTNNPGELLFDIDLPAAGELRPGEQPYLLVDGPAGARTELTPELHAPGRYRARMPATRAGLYKATLHAGVQSLTHAVYRDDNAEYHMEGRAAAQLQYWMQQEWLKPWPGAEAALASTPRDTAGLRQLVLVLALLSYLLVLILERGLVGPALRRVHARFSR